MKRIIAGVGLVLAALLLAGCGHRIDGTVIQKYHKDAYTYLVPITSCNGKGICTTTFVPEYVPECWGLVVQDAADEKRTDKTCVDVLVYSRLHVGDHYAEAA